MEFPPAPANDFAEYIRTYYDACRSRCDAVEAIAAKWAFRDLIPGLSDFDSRLVVRDGIVAADWCRMAEAVGEAHLELCLARPDWARNLEHLPGIALTWEELASERGYSPECRQWSFYDTARPERLAAAQEWLRQRPWDARDEHFHLRKLSLYYGRYDRSIDRPINIGEHVLKYPLHSRLLHYFAPPVASAVSLLERRHVPGKLDALDAAAHRFPQLDCWGMVQGILSRGYEAPEWYEESALVCLDDALEQALVVIAGHVREAATLLPPEAGTDAAQWKQFLDKAPPDRAAPIFEGIRYSRLMKGRLLFHARAPEGFEAEWLIRNELGRIGIFFFRAPARSWWEIRAGERVEDPQVLLERLRGSVLDAAQAGALAEFDRLVAAPCPPGEERPRALAIAGVLDGVVAALARIGEAV